jgi:hypothetical protein
MRPIATFIVLAVLAVAVPVVAQEVLTNDSVISMVKAGLPTSVIVGKIRSTEKKFDLSTNGLVGLKKAGVPDQVIEAMMGQTPAAGGTAAGTTAAARPADTTGTTQKLRDRDVIYHVDHDKYIELEPVLGTMKTQAMPFSVSNELVLKGRRAVYRAKDGQPVFLSAYGPTDAVLVRLEPGKKDDDRNLKLGGGGGYMSFSVKSGVRDKDRIDVVSERNEQGLYRVTPKSALPAGEYGFIVVGGTGTGSAKVFDFGVDKGE